MTAKEVTFRLAEEKLRFFYPKGLVWNPAKIPQTV